MGKQTLALIYNKVVIAKYEAILMRTLVAMVVRLLRRLKKPSRNDDLFSENVGWY
ncbi:hypothetical protein [Pedobacter sp. 22163]|uniref:hypothetical protein n=1 Tax=Pedobacter sp. 22163 TaxID=3453883 RepID=UPI003F85AB78